MILKKIVAVTKSKSHNDMSKTFTKLQKIKNKYKTYKNWKIIWNNVLFLV